MEPFADEPVSIRFTRDRGLPISATASVILHGAIIALVSLGFLSLFERPPAPPIEFEPIVIAEAPGGGAKGFDEASRFGSPTGSGEAVEAVETKRRVPPLPVSVPTADARREPPPPPKPEITDAGDPIEQRLAQFKPVPDLQSLLKGLPDARPGTGGVGFGSGQGTGTGPGTGDGDGSAGGRLSQKQRRQLRWTLLFNIRNAADYLDQLHRMKAIIGVQFSDKSIRLVTNLRQRPARLEAGDRVPDRIFWMDDSPDAVKSIADELSISPMPWRVIAFFPESLEAELLRKERAFGQRFGREAEEDFLETVFRVEERYGIIDISVLRQAGKK